MTARNALPFEFAYRWNDLRRFIAGADDVDAAGFLGPEVTSLLDQRDRDLEDHLGGMGGGLPIVVAASDASDEIRRRAHYACGGTADNIEIQAAIASAGTGGTVVLVGNTFTLAATVSVPDYVRIIGASIKCPFIYTTFDGAAFTLLGSGVHIEGMLIDTAGYFGGTVNTGSAIRAVASSGVNPSWLTVVSVETVTRSAAGVHVDGEGAPNGSQPGDYAFSHCAFFVTDAADAVYVRNARHVYWTNCAVFGAGAAGDPTVRIVKGSTGTQGQAHNMIWMGGSIYGDVTVGGAEVKFLGVKIADAPIGTSQVTLGSDTVNCFVVSCILDAPVIDSGTGNTVSLNTPDSITGDGIPRGASTVVGETAYGQASTVGTAVTYARGDHTHGTPPLPTPAQIGAATTAHTHSDVGGEQLVADGQASITALTNEAADDWLFQG